MGIRFQIGKVREVQNLIQKILEKVILTLFAKAGFYDESFIPTAYKPHHVAGAIGVIDALEEQLILRDVLSVSDNLRENEDALAF